MKLDKLTVRSQELLQSAHDIAQEFGNQAIEPIHFLKAMLKDDQGIVLSILKKIGVQVSKVQTDTRAALEKLVKVSGAGYIYLSR
jgi:ATP-dependent Clp protease ATP-binding subunit ClpB